MAGHEYLWSTHKVEEAWTSTSVLNKLLVSDPTIQQLGFDLLHLTSSLLNCFHTNKVSYAANLYKWHLTKPDKCQQGARHIILSSTAQTFKHLRVSKQHITYHKTQFNSAEIVCINKCWREMVENRNKFADILRYIVIIRWHLSRSQNWW